MIKDFWESQASGGSPGAALVSQAPHVQSPVMLQAHPHSKQRTLISSRGFHPCGCGLSRLSWCQGRSHSAVSRAALLHHHSKAGCYHCPSNPAGLMPALPSHPQGDHHNQGTLLCLTQPHLAPTTVCWQLVAPVLLSLVVVTHLWVSTLQRGMELLL